MLKFYYSGAPNPTKVALILEETGTPYDPIPIDTRKGEQHRPGFLAINPNAKLPAIVDGDVTVFDSSAILLYLAEKTGKFLPAKTDKARGELLSWMFFVASGVGPYFGQSVHFRVHAPEKIPYAINRYAFEAQRHAGILDARLAKQKYILGDTYTIIHGSKHRPWLAALFGAQPTNGNVVENEIAAGHETSRLGLRIFRPMSELVDQKPNTMPFIHDF
jgi:GST-like protein